jgi:hypothetical protein
MYRGWTQTEYQNKHYNIKTWGTEDSKGNKTVPTKMVTTRTEDGHKQNTKTSTTYRPKGRRNIGRLRKRRRDQLHFEDEGRGNTPNTSCT